MTQYMANLIIGARKRRISKYNNVRFFDRHYEYKLVYESGWVGTLSVYRRPEYKTRGRFEFVTLFAEDDLGMEDVIGYIKGRVASA